MSEVDERTMGNASAFPRYAGDVSTYVPNYQVNGWQVGRNLTGESLTPDIYAGALNVFLSGPVSSLESVIRQWSDHSEVHAGTLIRGRETHVGRSYYVKGALSDLRKLGSLAHVWSDIPPTLMVPSRRTTYSHLRAIIPLERAGDVPTIIQRMASIGPIIQHLDYNGYHVSLTCRSSIATELLASLQTDYLTSSVRVVGMNAARYESINLETYKVELL